MIDNYEDAPIYFWYLVHGISTWDCKRYFYKGKTYAAYVTEPEPREIDKAKLQYVGIGDYDFIRKGVREND